jgi:uncharacterized protein YdhG (YjbR/CyaY superfamily)
MTDTQKTATKSRTRATSEGFSAEERAAMKGRASELRRGKKTDGAADLRAAIDKMPEPDRALAEGIHAVVMAAVPDLEQKTWYGFPSYAKGGALLFYFKPASKFKTRFSTFEFTDKAKLEDGEMWPTAYAVTELTPAAKAKITELVRQAAG